MAARVTRHAFEVLAQAPTQARTTRQGVQVALERPGANTAAEARVARHSFEVLAQSPTIGRVTRQGVQVAVERPTASGSTQARVARLGVEVLGNIPTLVRTTRQGIQVAVERPGANDAAVWVGRSSFEVLARSFIPMTGFSAPANFELFLHNWANGCTLESAYSTDISASAEALAEERVGLIEKPYRALTVSWSARGEDEVNRFLVEMRRLVDETSVVPLYCDATQVTANASAGANTLLGDFSQARFFQNGLAVVVQFDATLATESSGVTRYEFVRVDRATNTEIEFQSNLVNSYVGKRTVVIPMLRTHPQVEVGIEAHNAHLVTLTATFDEIYGPTALPPVASDLPGNFDSYNDIPILSVSPNWASGLSSAIRREGSMDALGRGRVVHQRGARGRVMTALTFDEYRSRAWDLINFFDSRRGRLIPFWVADHHNLFTVQQIDPSFVSIDPRGSLTDFQAEMEYVGFLFKDGKASVRRATVIQLVAGSWRITLDSSLPAGYTASDVLSFGRARLCRMESDALSEVWSTTNVCSMNVPILELLAEEEVDL